MSRSVINNVMIICFLTIFVVWSAIPGLDGTETLWWQKASSLVVQLDKKMVEEKDDDFLLESNLAYQQYLKLKEAHTNGLYQTFKNEKLHFGTLGLIRQSISKYPAGNNVLPLGTYEPAFFW